MKKLLISFPDEKHADGLAAQMESMGIEYQRQSERCLVFDYDESDAFNNMVIHHCGFKQLVEG